MRGINLKGMGVALVTPFNSDKSIDFGALGRLVDFQIENGADYLVVLGTTAETPTLSADERVAVKNFVRERVGGRLPLVIGHGGNDTVSLVNSLKSDDFGGFDALLSVVPYYNKPSQEGIFRHYVEIAEASPLPLILYNVPGRTGVNMTAETTLRLAGCSDKIIGVKEASGNIVQADMIIKNKPEGFDVISGDDAMTYPLLTLGASGVISVVGNAFPKEFGHMVRLCLDHNYEVALSIHHKFTELFSLLFVDGNPAGVKCLLAAMDMIQNELRLPLVPTRLDTNEKIHHVLENLRNLHKSR